MCLLEAAMRATHLLRGRHAGDRPSKKKSIARMAASNSINEGGSGAFAL